MYKYVHNKKKYGKKASIFQVEWEPYNEVKN